MMTHPLVDQLRFARFEFSRCMAGISDADSVRRVGSMNCLSWFIGHLANQENAYWVYLAQGISLHPELRDLSGWGYPGSTPPLEQVWGIWREVTAAADRFLDVLAADDLAQHFAREGKRRPESIGTMLYRNIYHYWFHTGEAHGVRQALGHTGLADFVGDMGQAQYRPPEP